MTIEKLKLTLLSILPDKNWLDEELNRYISLALLDASMVANIPAGLAFGDLSDGLQNAILTGARALAIRTVLIEKAKEQATFGETEMTLELDIETSDLLRVYNKELESFKQLCSLNKINIKVQ